jgi:ribonuclease BN (tRNA processing enzyme)
MKYLLSILVSLLSYISLSGYVDASEGLVKLETSEIDTFALGVPHGPVPENIGGTGRKLHAPPSIIGNIATETGASTLVLSHFMARSLYKVEESLKVIRSRFTGSLVSANDLDCINL